MGFKLNPLYGTLDLVSIGPDLTVDNFSYQLIQTFQTITIPYGQEMVYTGPLVVEGEMHVMGNTTELVDYSLWAFSWNRIPIDITLRVDPDRDMLFCNNLLVEGELVVLGNLIQVG